MNTNSVSTYSPLRLDLYVAQVQSSMMAHRPSSPDIALEQKMSRQGDLREI